MFEEYFVVNFNSLMTIGVNSISSKYIIVIPDK